MENHNLYEKYLSGEMTPEEKAGFEKMLETDKEFESGFELYKELDALVLLAIKRDEFQMNLIDAEKNAGFATGSRKSKRIHCRKMWFMAAASVMAVIMLSVSLYFIFFTAPDYNKLYADNYAPLNVSLTTRSAERDTGILYNALILYHKKEYAECINELQSLNLPNDLSQVRNTFLGLSYLANNDLINAEHYLLITVRDSLHVMYDDCLWFLALTYLKANHINDCRKYLEILVKNESAYRKRAEDLLDEL